jgi:hypothetical protein
MLENRALPPQNPAKIPPKCQAQALLRRPQARTPSAAANSAQLFRTKLGHYPFPLDSPPSSTDIEGGKTGQ